MNLKDFISDELDKPIPPHINLEHDFGISGVSAEHRKTITYGEVLAKQMVHQACSGVAKSMTEVMDRMMGKSSQAVKQKTTEVTYENFLDECEARDEDDDLLGDLG
jgi:hypothetical protein